jgi:hypothetical protein
MLFFDVIAIHLNKLTTEAPEKYFTFRVFCSLSCAVSDFDRRCMSSVLQRIGERYDVCRHHQQRRRINQRETGGRQKSEDGEMFLRNVGWLSEGYTAFYPVIPSN